MQTVETYVKDLGGGFIMVGGENTYGKDGYSNTPIEKILPVTFETKKRPPTIAMVAVIDVSGSMSGGQLTIAKEAAKAPLKALRNSDRFGTLSFNTGFSWVAPLQPQEIATPSARRLKRCMPAAARTSMSGSMRHTKR